MRELRPAHVRLRGDKERAALEISRARSVAGVAKKLNAGRNNYSWSRRYPNGLVINVFANGLDIILDIFFPTGGKVYPLIQMFPTLQKDKGNFINGYVKDPLSESGFRPWFDESTTNYGETILPTSSPFRFFEENNINFGGDLVEPYGNTGWSNDNNTKIVSWWGVTTPILRIEDSLWWRGSIQNNLETYTYRNSAKSNTHSVSLLKMRTSEPGVASATDIADWQYTDSIKNSFTVASDESLIFNKGVYFVWVNMVQVFLPTIYLNQVIGGASVVGDWLVFAVGDYSSNIPTTYYQFLTLEWTIAAKNLKTNEVKNLFTGLTLDDSKLYGTAFARNWIRWNISKNGEHWSCFVHGDYDLNEHIGYDFDAFKGHVELVEGTIIWNTDTYSKNEKSSMEGSTSGNLMVCTNNNGDTIRVVIEDLILPRGTTGTELFYAEPQLKHYFFICWDISDTTKKVHICAQINGKLIIDTTLPIAYSGVPISYSGASFEVNLTHFMTRGSFLSTEEGIYVSLPMHFLNGMVVGSGIGANDDILKNITLNRLYTPDGGIIDIGEKVIGKGYTGNMGPLIRVLNPTGV